MNDINEKHLKQAEIVNALRSARIVAEVKYENAQCALADAEGLAKMSKGFDACSNGETRKAYVQNATKTEALAEREAKTELKMAVCEFENAELVYKSQRDVLLAGTKNL